MLLPGAGPRAEAKPFFLQVGTEIVSLTSAATVVREGRQFVNMEVLAELVPRTQRASDQPSTTIGTAISGPASTMYELGGQRIELNEPGEPLGGAVDGRPIPLAELLAWDGASYLSAAYLEQLGLLLSYNSREEIFQLLGRITDADYSQTKAQLNISCLTPIAISGTQGDDGVVTLEIEGGYFSSQAPREYPGDPLLTRIGFKSLPGQGRSMVYIRQPKRSGYRIRQDNSVGGGFASVDFGNYFQLASYQLTSSGEISLNVQLGAPAELSEQYLDNPPRLVLDFEGAVYDEATGSIPVSKGNVSQIRIGQPQPGTVRVVADLRQRLDYRVLSTDGGARYYCQFLPPLEALVEGPGREAPLIVEPATPEQPLLRPVGQRNRVIMLDAGHGGSDPGAPGVIEGTHEKNLTLIMCGMLQSELEALGYTVLQTRTADRFVSLGARTDYANLALPYIFVSIHCNSIEDPEFEGLMTFIHPAASRESRALAALVQSSGVQAVGAVDKGVREANFFVLRETVMPSILIETGFLSHAEECKRLVDTKYQRRLMQATAAGIDRFVLGY